MTLKGLLRLILLGMGGSSAFAQTQQVAVASQSWAGYSDFSPVSAVSTLPVLDLRNYLFHYHTVQGSFTGTAPTTCTYALDYSMDNWMWFSGTSTDCTTGAMTTFSTHIAKFVRVRVITFSGSTPVRFYYAGSR